MKIERSSWVALRVFPSSHTNPIWVLVGDQPVRTITPQPRVVPPESVDQCWSQKEPTYAAAEKEQAKKDYDHARQVYRQRLAEATAD